MSDIQGERGPQGDHGQHGDTGDTGHVGPAGPQGVQGKRGGQFTGWSFARLLAFALVAAVAAFAVVQTANESKARDKAILQERTRVGDIYTTSLSQGSASGCIADNKVIYAQRAQLKDQIANAAPAYEQLVHDGTLTQTQVDRLLTQGQKSVDRYLERLPYRDCVASAERYAKLIQDKKLKALQEEKIKNDTSDATDAIAALEKSDEARRKRN